MTQPIKLDYGDREVSPSGMATELLAGSAEGGRWPFESSRWSVPPGATSELDVHEVVEVWLVRRGSGTLHSNGSNTHLVPGDAVLMPSEVPHRVTAGPEQLEVFSIWWPRDLA